MTKTILMASALALTVCAWSPAHAADSKLTDPQIAHIAYTAGEIDIKNAELALKKTKNAEIKTFAEDMLRDHKDVNDKALALVKKLNVTPEDNATSQSLVKGADEEREKLAKLDGAAFDKAYAENEVSYHHAVNTTLEKTLIPDSSNKDLKDLLSTGLKIFQGHEEHAKKVSDALK
jgi:putative membrane protein